MKVLSTSFENLKKKFVSDDLRVETGNKQKELTLSTAYIIEIAHFLYKETQSNEIKDFLTQRIPKLIKLAQIVDLNEAAFLSTKETEPVLLLNYKLIKAIKNFDSKLLSKENQLLF